MSKCPFDQEEGDDRKYYLLAGGKIELQNKASGSTARMFATKADGEVFRCSVNLLTMDDFMESMANAMHDSIEKYSAGYNQWKPISEAPDQGSVIVGLWDSEGNWQQQLVQHWSVKTLASTGWTHYSIPPVPPQKEEK
jgi:hypothetical protein